MWRAVSPAPFSAGLSLSPSPVLLTAGLNTGTNVLTLTFDSPLKAGTTQLGTVVFTSSLVGTRRTTAQAYAAGSVLTLATSLQSPIGTDPARCDYDATPEIFIGEGGGAVAAWDDFPVTVT